MKAFERNVEKGNPNECWIWKGKKRGSLGYGVFSIGDGNLSYKNYGAHRFAWMLHWQLPIPPGLFCCHTCDVPRCVNPHHLVLGTAKTNALDMMNKDRKMKVKRHVRLAIADAIMGGLSQCKAVKRFKIPTTSIHRYLQCKEVRDKYGIIDLSHRWSKKKVMHGQQSISDTQVYSVPNPL